MTIEHVPVKSHHLASVGYDAPTLTLEVKFHNGTLYRYSGVPRTVFGQLLAAVSPGVFFNAHIKHGGYAYSVVKGDGSDAERT